MSCGFHLINKGGGHRRLNKSTDRITSRKSQPSIRCPDGGCRTETGGEQHRQQGGPCRDWSEGQSQRGASWEGWDPQRSGAAVKVKEEMSREMKESCRNERKSRRASWLTPPPQQHRLDVARPRREPAWQEGHSRTRGSALWVRGKSARSMHATLLQEKHQKTRIEPFLLVTVSPQNQP